MSQPGDQRRDDPERTGECDDGLKPAVETPAATRGRALGAERGARPLSLLRCAVTVAVAITALTLPASAGAYVYWANYNLTNGTTVGRANLDGAGANHSFITGIAIPTAVAVDGRHVYWTSLIAGTVGRANLDGTAADRFFITGADSPFGVAVDPQHVYWTTSGAETDAIGRANLDGTAADQSFITGAGSPDAVAVDRQHIYWTNPDTNSIGRANVNGTGVDQSFISLHSGIGPNGVAVDGRHIYWTTDGHPGAIGRANLDGSAIDPSFIAAGDIAPRGVAVNGQHIYWANAAAGTIGQANLDGSAPDPNFIVGPAPWGLAVDSLPYPTSTSVTCSPTPVTLPASTSCTATVTDTADPSAPTGIVSSGSTGSGSFSSPGSCVLVATGEARSACQLSFTPSLPGAETITAAYVGEVVHAASSGTASLTVLAPPSSAGSLSAKPSNSFALSRPKINRRNGSAVLTATIPDAGTLRLTGHRIKQLARSVSRAGTVKLTIKARPSIARRLRRTGKATVIVRVTYTPTGGDPNTKSKKLTLRRDRR
jgi:virginiamycin B lyase